MIVANKIYRRFSVRLRFRIKEDKELINKFYHIRHKSTYVANLIRKDLEN